MSAAAVCFIWYAANHPEKVSPLGGAIGWIYFLYVVFTMALFILADRFYARHCAQKRREKEMPREKDRQGG